MRLDLTATVRGRPCAVAVSVAPNIHPAQIGTAPHASGFPVCTATIETGLRGYDAVMGWIQFVAAGPAAASRPDFELDPLEVHADIATPYAFHGVTPTLFDGPSRRDRSRDMSWSAQSYLCIGVPTSMSRCTMAVAGFSWGFEMSAAEIRFHRPEALGGAQWADRIPLLHRSFSAWDFVPADGGW